MNQILDLREKRAKAWDGAKAFLDTKRSGDGTLSTEDAATYDKMETNVVNLGHEIERLERQAAMDMEMNSPTMAPLVSSPQMEKPEGKKGRSSEAYKNAFWRVIRQKSVPHEVYNALQIGVESEGGYTVPDEFERTLVEALQEENIMAFENLLYPHRDIEKMF